ncbi:hypothetical protein INT44_004254 [Umbelopsis vinacea]|uniref:Fork-head domain-containing protein n=1 Tax=Umbelopsis vinacea TaxID=44442 RepID=A0A8H7UPB4_9FUNG|nr:hypothetical protein INT44_004254 [Umbelopsis vinacea]
MNETHTSNNWYPPACDTDFAFQLPITPNDYTSTFQVTMPASQSNSGRLTHRRRASCAISIIQESPAGHVPGPPQPCPSRSLSDSMLVVKPGRECITSFDNEANTNTRQWPMDIRTWWKPSHANEKPPYSYATLIAHAILCSAHGKLTLSDIYRWISEQYPYYALGSHGWQNSIRHNLSLNKRSFVKLERRPSKQNPGKGSYWAIIPGAERPFIENLTRKGGPRRHHQSTLPLGAQFAVADTPHGLSRHDSAIDVEGDGCKITKLCSANLLITVPEDYQEHKTNTRSGSSDYLHISNVEEEEVASIQYSPDQFTQTTRSTSPLYTTFRMSKVEKEKPTQSISRRTRRSKKRKQRTREDSYDSDCDSGVDVSNEYIGSLHKRKQRRKLAKDQQAETQKAELNHETLVVTAEEESSLELSWRNMLASGLELLCPDQPGFDLYNEFSYLTNAEGEGPDYFSHCPQNVITRPLDIDLSLQHPLQKEAQDKQDQNDFASKNFSSMLESLPVGMHKTKSMSPDLSGVTFAQLLQSATVDDETSKYLRFESSDDEETSNSTDSYCVTPPSLPLDDLYPQLQ